MTRPDHDLRTAGPVPRPRPFWLVIVVAAGWIGLGQLTKILAENYLTWGYARAGGGK